MLPCSPYRVECSGIRGFSGRTAGTGYSDAGFLNENLIFTQPPGLNPKYISAD